MDKSLNILYVLSSAGLLEDSVQKKVRTQIQYLNTQNSTCKGAFFSFEIEDNYKLSDTIDLVPIQKIKGKLFSKIKQQNNTLLAIKEYLNTNARHYQIIYFRYFGASKILLDIVKEHKHKIVFEIQGINLEEIKNYKFENSFKFNISCVLSYIQFYYYPLLIEKLYLKKILNFTDKNICISHEILNYHQKLSDKNYFVVANGISTSNFNIKQQTSIKDNTLNFLFLKGTTTIAPWNGIDRIINAIKNYKGKYNIQLFIVGHKLNDEIPQANFIHHFGYLTDDALNDIFNKCHLGIGTLALYRKNLHEASPLKTREYYARGLPFIYAYSDTDIDEYSALKPFALCLENSDRALPMNEIIEFCIENNHQNVANEMHNLASQYLSIEKKMQRIIKFLN